jgi:serine/threonine protein kinase
MSGNHFSNVSRELFQGRYQIIKQLSKTPNTGRHTLLAQDLQTQKEVVIKVLTFDNNFRWEDLKLFEREAEILKTLSHPAIPRYLDYFEWDSSSQKEFGLVQTYIEAKSLQEYLDAGRTFSETEVKQLAKSLLEVLSYLHKQQPPVIHRDIKPSNILLSIGEACAKRSRSGNSLGNVYLVDFGSVQTTSRQDGTITIVGTYGYMPPEQFVGRTTPASDLYSLGATLIHLVTGQFPGDLPQEDLQIQFEQFTHISPELVKWLKWMTQPSPKHRLASATGALQVLEQPPPPASPIAKKPAGSKISLTKSPDSLEIQLEKSDTRLSAFDLFFMAVVWIIMSLFPGIFVVVGISVFWSSLFSGNLGIIGVLFGLMFAGAGLAFIIFMLYFFLDASFGEKLLRIDKHNITFTHNLFGRQLSDSRQNPRQEIQKLVCTERYYYMQKEESGSSRKEVPPGLYIQAGGNKYNFSSFKNLTPPERDWLAQELSDWLGLPITRK